MVRKTRNYYRLQLASLFTVTLAFVLLISFALAPVTSIAATQAQTKAGWSLLERRDTGYVVMIRHAEAPGTGDPANFRLGDCSTQRNLSGAGRAQAVRVGGEFRRRNIPVARVLSSQWCRCLDTARLLNLGKVEPFAALNSFFANQRTESRQTEEVRSFIINNRSTQGAIIMVTHQVNITALTGIVPQSGESVVLRANQQGKVELVGRISAA